MYSAAAESLFYSVFVECLLAGQRYVLYIFLYIVNDVLACGKLRGIKPDGLHNFQRRTFIRIGVICLPCEMRSLFLRGEIRGLKIGRIE